MGRKEFLSMLFVFICFQLVSQVNQEWSKTDYGREIIALLTGEKMHGRGYVNEGDQLAAKYMKEAFQKFSLKSFTGGYEQKFSFSVNTFPGEIICSLIGNDDKLKKKIVFNGKPAINMLIGPGCDSTDKTYPVATFDSTYAISDRRFEKFKKKITADYFVLINDNGVTDKNKLAYFKKAKDNYFNTAGVIEITKKLTHTVSQQKSNFLTIKLLSDSLHLNFQKTKQLSLRLKIENKFIEEHVAENIIGYVEGKQHADSFIVFSAHYDHLGQLGKDIYFPGANDNASGCAMLLNLARYYSLPENKPDYSIVFIAFAGEEIGLLGSTYYTKHPLFPLRNIRFLLNMDIMGTGDEGITVVNGTLLKNEFEKMVAINRENDFLKEIKIRGKAANSDHYPFSENGVKAFFIYTMGGIKAYHDVYDKAETLPLTKFEELFKLITHFTDYLQHH